MALSLWMVNLYPKSYTFYLFFSSFIQYFHYMCGPDPYKQYGSGSTKLLNTDTIRIRIHKTGDTGPVRSQLTGPKSWEQSYGHLKSVISTGSTILRTELQPLKE